MQISQAPAPVIQRYCKTSADDLSGLWFDAYGWIACYFAQLEGLGYALIERLGHAEDTARLSKLPYQARMEKAKNLICEYLNLQKRTELADEWAEFMDEARSAAQMRNKILHNPLTVSLALGNLLHDPDAGIVLTHDPGKPILKLGTVQLFSQKMLDLNLRMHDLLARSGLSAAQSRQT